MSRADDRCAVTDCPHIENDTDRILKLQHELGRILAEAVDPAAGLQSALDRVVSVLELDAVWTWIRVDSGGGFSLRHMAGSDDSLVSALNSLPADSPLARRLDTGQESVGAWDDIWRTRPHSAPAPGWARCAVLPIVSQGEVVGALGGGGRDAACLGGDNLWVLRTLANAAGLGHPKEARPRESQLDGAPVDIAGSLNVVSRLDLARENERLVTAINQVAESIVVTDDTGAIEYVNPAFCRMTGYTRDDVIGKNPRVLKSGLHDDAFYRGMWETLKRGEVWTGRISNRRRDGELFVEDATLSPILAADGTITHFVGVKRDVTAEIEVEERLREKQKMEAVGTLVGGIAHDFNNILYALLGYVDLALDDVPAGHPAHSALTEIATAGQRASHLVARMLTFGRRGDGERESVDLADVVTDGLELVRASLPASIQIVPELTKSSCRVTADVAQFHQVLLSLCQNAGEAMADQEGGELRVSVSTLELDDQAARQVGELKPGTWARLTVADTGCGMDPVILDRIFEPYFTTRAGLLGHGLGLATVHGIVSSHDGRIFAASERGVGTEFTIYLPAEPNPGPVNGPAATGAEPTVGHGRIMVIDDEPMVADVLERTLIHFGFEARIFLNGVEALEVFRAAPDDFDVVITDQSLPHLTGFELASQMLAIRPGLPLIMITGHGGEDFQATARKVGVSRLMAKPVNIRELGELLMELTTETTVSH